MRIFPMRFIFLFLSVICQVYGAQIPQHNIASSGSDPDAFIDNCVNVINGDYCETTTDLVIAGPDPLVVQRYYNAQNCVTGQGSGGWRIFPQCHLVLGKDRQNRECMVSGERFESTYAYVGSRSGTILTYSGWKKIGGGTKDPLKIDFEKDGVGMVNTYAKEINGQTNHQNNRLHCKTDGCELILGDSTKCCYEKVASLPSVLFGEEIVPLLANMVNQPQYFRLLSETLPSGNEILYSYDSKGHLKAIEMKNAQ